MKVTLTVDIREDYYFGKTETAKDLTYAIQEAALLAARKQGAIVKGLTSTISKN
jgi:hypothetical protein